MGLLHGHLLQTRRPLERVRALDLLCSQPFGAWAQETQRTSIATGVPHSWRSTRSFAQLHGRPVVALTCSPG
jgi:hypothetical protein